jgi:hypothetical protein
MESNVGKAIKGECGHWIPFMDESVDTYIPFEV